MRFNFTINPYYLFGVAIILNSLTTMALLQKVYGDSTTSKSESIIHQLTQKNQER